MFVADEDESNHTWGIECECGGRKWSYDDYPFGESWACENGCDDVEEDEDQDHEDDVEGDDLDDDEGEDGEKDDFDLGFEAGWELGTAVNSPVVEEILVAYASDKDDFVGTIVKQMADTYGIYKAWADTTGKPMDVVKNIPSDDFIDAFLRGTVRGAEWVKQAA